MLLNVERDVLREAVTIAKVWDLFNGRERWALLQLADLFETKFYFPDDDPFRIAEIIIDALPSPLSEILSWVLALTKAILYGTGRTATEENIVSIKNAIVQNMAEISTIVIHVQTDVLMTTLHENLLSRADFLAKNSADQARLLAV